MALATALLAGCGADQLGAAPARPYARPGHLVQLPDGRKLNLYCSGRGSPTVLLESGFGAGAFAWGKVQPTIAWKTRVCAYDRAGYGFSDPGPLPRDGATIARDLDLALQAAGIRGPYIVVGHSAGALYARLFAARRLDQVQGLVLLDPTVERVAAQTAGDGLDGIRRRYQRCLAAVSAGQPSAADLQSQGCLPAKASPGDLSHARRPDTWKNRLSELDAIFGRASQSVIRIGGLLRQVPVYVITSSDTAAGAPRVGFDPPQSVWELQHLQLAGMSRRGFQQTVLSSHLVMVDRPDVVISAIEAMIRAVRAGRPPEPLPASENEPTDGGNIFALPPFEPGPAGPEGGASLPSLWTDEPVPPIAF